MEKYIKERLHFKIQIKYKTPGCFYGTYTHYELFSLYGSNKRIFDIIKINKVKDGYQLIINTNQEPILNYISRLIDKDTNRLLNDNIDDSLFQIEIGYYSYKCIKDKNGYDCYRVSNLQNNQFELLITDDDINKYIDKNTILALKQIDNNKEETNMNDVIFITDAKLIE